MKKVEITYRCEGDGARAPERPIDVEAAQRRMNEGSKAFASLFAGTDEQAELVQHVIQLDPHDLGLRQDVSAAPRQLPFAVVLGCSDARVPVELIFNEGPNELFVVRVAGNILGDDVRGSLNYALDHLRESLKLVAVLGHSACGAITAAVDVFLDTADYLSLASNHTVRMLVDRLQVVVQAAARRLRVEFGSDVTRHPRYREALIEVSVITNAALVAHTLQREIGSEAGNEVGVSYGAYVLEDRTVWAPRCNSDEVLGLATPPEDAKGFVEFGNAVLRSKRIAAMLA